MNKLTLLIVALLFLTACSTEELEFLDTENVVIKEEASSNTALLADELPKNEPATAEPVMVSVEVLPSKALRTALEAIKENLNGTAKTKKNRENQGFALCFQFVYPLMVEFNDGASKQLNDYDALLQVLLDESSARYLTGLGFPFEILEAGSETPVAITNEDDFKALIANCGYEQITYADIINAFSPCFTVSYPLDLIINDTVKTFDDQDEAVDFFNTYWSSSATVSISYPFRATLHTGEEDQLTSIENDFEMINLIKNSCDIN